MGNALKMFIVIVIIAMRSVLRIDDASECESNCLNLLYD